MKEQVKLKYLLLTVTIFLSYCFEAWAAFDYGLVFRSYEVSPEERTSLTASAAGSHTLKFTDSLRVDFTLKFNLDIGKFGYICSIIIDNAEPMDVLLYTPSHEESAIYATGDHENMTKIPIHSDRWHDLSISVSHEGDSAHFNLNGKRISSILTRQDRIEASICFGKNSQNNYETDDVAPMVIKDLGIKVDRNETARWKLTGSENESSGKIRLSTVNPLWLKDLNCKWSLARTFQVPSVSYICPDEENGIIYIISDKTVSRYDVSSMTLSQWQTSNDIRTDLTTNDYIILEDGTLAYLDIDSPAVIRFDLASHDWERSNPRTKRSIYLHDNIMYDRDGGRYLQMFGYGQHRYQKSIKSWDPEQDSVSVYDINGLTPRYLAAAGMRDGKIYVYSGKGNIQGAQEFGTRIYNDFIEIDLSTLTARTLWTGNGEEDEVAASNLIPESNRNSFLALTYNPKSYNTYLQLKRIDTEGSAIPLAQSLPFNFLDIESEAKLMYCAKTNAYYAITSQKNNDGHFAISIYTILSPISEQQESTSKVSSSVIIILTLLAAGIGIISAIAVTGRRRRSKHSKGHSEDGLADLSYKKKENETPGVYILGGFKVINKAGEDISGSFSPLMKQLLSIIILNSDTDGISNAKLKDTLWFDKSDNSYNNNRGVTLTKIRTYLQEVDESLVITSNNGYWRIDDPNGSCDYLKAQTTLNTKNCSLENLIGIAMLGNIMPDSRIEWLDLYKGEYENRIISALRKMLENVKGQDDDPTRIQIADAILLFDPLDEDCVRLKCQCLITLKRAGLAKRAFDHFCDNYYHTLGEKFEENFTDFIKKATH